MGRLSLLLLSHVLEKPQRLSREQNARPRNSPLLRERIERTKIACLSWLQSSKERLKPTNNRSKRLRNAQSLLWSCKWQPESSQNNLKDDLFIFPHLHKKANFKIYLYSMPPFGYLIIENKLYHVICFVSNTTSVFK